MTTTDLHREFSQLDDHNGVKDGEHVLDDPSSFPGHMQPLGSHQKFKEEIEILKEYPSPEGMVENKLNNQRDINNWGFWDTSAQSGAK